ncbi:MAG TPA: fatty acid desaturase [Vicinamibacterales bacterium]|nr:fatty acid desaturase [Vicinamibacterales bacterium]
MGTELAASAPASLRTAVHEKIPRDWYVPDRRIYWTDLVASAAIGWAALAGAALSDAMLVQAGLALVATFALYRATSFIHELTHVNRRELPWFDVAWHAVAGIPLLVPLFLYEGVHLDHHRPRLYGTDGDPEYLPFAHQPAWMIGLFAASATLLPIAMVLRFAVLAPISWLVPPLRRRLLARASSLAINPRYVRQRRLAAAGLVQEAMCAVVCWTAVTAWATGVLPGRLIVAWTVVAAAAAAINAVRVLAAHRYESDGHEMTTLGQLLDSRTIIAEPARGMRAVWELLFAPVGLRYHALHHWIPALPYHSLGRTHRLVVGLAAAGTYCQTMSTLQEAVVALLRRQEENRSAGLERG